MRKRTVSQYQRVHTLPNDGYPLLYLTIDLKMSFSTRVFNYYNLFHDSCPTLARHNNRQVSGRHGYYILQGTFIIIY